MPTNWSGASQVPPTNQSSLFLPKTPSFFFPLGGGFPLRRRCRRRLYTQPFGSVMQTWGPPWGPLRRPLKGSPGLPAMESRGRCKAPRGFRSRRPHALGAPKALGAPGRVAECCRLYRKERLRFLVLLLLLDIMLLLLLLLLLVLEYTFCLKQQRLQAFFFACAKTPRAQQRALQHGCR